MKAGSQGNDSGISYRRSLDRLSAVAEERGPFKAFQRTPERLVAAAWFDQQLNHDHLVTVDGRSLQVLSPGRWEDGAGPDFRDAEIRFSGRKTVTGDIEVEVFASDWDRHKHRNSVEFGNVVLKVCMWNDIRSERKSAIPMLELFPHLASHCTPSLHSTADYPFTSPTMKGRCTPIINEGKADQALAFIAAAGDDRIHRKSQRLGTLIRTFGADQTLYKGVMEAMGYSANKEPMSRLADAVHLELIRSIIEQHQKLSRQDTILALFYGCSGFFERFNAIDVGYIVELKSIWDEISNRRQLPIVDGFRLAKVRPANSPWRRMAAVSSWLSEYNGLKLYDGILGIIEELQEHKTRTPIITRDRLNKLFTSLSHPFWDRRLSPTGKEGAKSYKLIGGNLASIIVVNIVLPLLLAQAERSENVDLKRFALEVFSNTGGQQHNAVTRFTCARLFGPKQIEPKFARNARLHQGLIQIYNDFCHSLRRDCPECALPDFLDSE